MIKGKVQFFKERILRTLIFLFYPINSPNSYIRPTKNTNYLNHKNHLNTMLSFWEKNTLTTYDYIIVGAGIVGLSTAASIIEQYDKARILVVERSLFPTGASTKNAGFACFGSVSELLDDLTKMPETAVQELVKERWTGLQLLRKRLGDQSIGYLNHGGYELIFSKEVAYTSHIGKINAILHPIFQEQVFEQKDALIDSFQFNKEEVKHLIYNKFEAQIDTGAMMDSLLTYVQKKGVRVLTGCEVTDLKTLTMVFKSR